MMKANKNDPIANSESHGQQNLNVIDVDQSTIDIEQTFVFERNDLVDASTASTLGSIGTV